MRACSVALAAPSAVALTLVVLNATMLGVVPVGHDDVSVHVYIVLFTV